MKKTLFIKNAAIMTANTLALRGAGVIFKIWVAAGIGDEGMGLYTLVLSVYTLCSSFASVGIATCVTRTVSDCEARRLPGDGVCAAKRCINLCFIACGAILPVLFFGNGFIAANLIKDSRTALSIKLCGFALPFVSVCSCIKGYFIGVRKTLIPCLSQQFEQAVRITVTVILLNFCRGDISLKIAAVTAGDVAAEFCAAVFLAVFFKLKTRNLTKGRYGYKNLLKIALPLCGSKYINGVLRTFESMLVPIMLAKYYLRQSAALSTVGIIKGMVLPILLFPGTMLSAVTALLLPEMASANACRHKNEISYTTRRAVRLTFIFGLLAAALFFTFGNELGRLLYSNEKAGKMIVLLSPLVPLMYIDSLCDALLKGLDKHIFTLKLTVSDSVIRIILIYFMLSRTGNTGFIIIMYLSNLYTSLANLIMAMKTANTRINLLSFVFLPALCAASCCTVSKAVLKNFCAGGAVYLIIAISGCIAAYFVLLLLCGCFNDEKQTLYNEIRKRKVAV